MEPGEDGVVGVRKLADHPQVLQDPALWVQKSFWWDVTGKGHGMICILVFCRRLDLETEIEAEEWLRGFNIVWSA